MKKKIPILLALVLIVAACIVFIHPVKVVSGTQTRYVLKFSKTTSKLDAIADISGGARCYINEDEYIWLSNGTYETDFSRGPISITWGFPWELNTLNRGG